MTIFNGEYERAETLYLDLRERHNILGEKNYRLLTTRTLGQLAMEMGEIDKAKGYFEEAIKIGGELEGNMRIALCLALLCNTIFWDGDEEKFRQLVDEGARMVKSSPKLGKRDFLLFLLKAFHAYDPRSTAIILGALKYSEEGTLVPIWKWDKRFMDRAEAGSREVLGEAAFESAFADGQKMSFDDALDLVLKSLDDVRQEYI
jgi:tetratricopeptide (TPR) repeat protein